MGVSWSSLPVLWRVLGTALSVVVAASAGGQQPRTQGRAPFELEEATIAQIHAAMGAGALTCRGLVEQYLRRIDVYDKNGPALNAIVAINPDALRVADELDRRFVRQGVTGPLHCVPVIVKDNFETVGLPTTAGSLSLKGFVSSRDAFMVRRLREAGAVVLAKSNMAEFAFSPYETVNSILPGYTRNPYALDRVTAGSSGGTAAAVAANFGAVGLGTDTGNSIRGPSAHQSLVGIRSTMGLTSRAGIVPLYLSADIAGPMARTVADAAAVLQVVAGEDPDDPVTVNSRGRVPPSYAAFLQADGLRGARIGVLRQAYERTTTDPEVVQLFRAAIDDMRRQGATIVDPVVVDSLEVRLRGWTENCDPFKHDFEQWLAGHGGRAPVRSLKEVIESRKFHPSIQKRLEAAQAFDQPLETAPGCVQRDAFRAWLRTAVLRVMDDNKLDALVYPTWSNPPRLIGDLNTPHGDNNQLFSPSTGFPAITVPMGYLRGGVLPAGVQFFGRAWSEPVLIKLAYAYEQATKHRRPPPTVPPLGGG
jgi:Asp-tRNA(Asn)/Glu-tRNA(Gln) amidotransferase A subunit family amidase